MKRRIIVAAIFLPIFFIILFYLPAYAFAIVVALVCVVSAYELLRATGIKNNDRVSIYAVFSAALIPAGVYFDVSLLVFQAVILTLACLMFIEAIIAYKSKKQISFAQVVVVLFAGAIMPFMLSSLISMKNMSEGRLIVLLPVISAFVTDAGAYFAGVFFGKKRPFILVSPQKTVEGCIGGLAAGVFSMLIYGVILAAATRHLVTFWALILYGLIGAFLTELGDLSFSLIKREYDVKDFGRLLPGHGGMLDRFDSMVFTAPAIYLLMSVIPVIVVKG